MDRKGSSEEAKVSDPNDRSTDDTDDFDPTFGSDFDEDLADDIAIDVGSRPDYSPSAWQRLDARREDAWLREQLSDWGDWDNDSEAH